MAKAAVRTAASTDPDIEIEAEATPTAPRAKSKVVKMPKASAPVVVEPPKSGKAKTAKATKASVEQAPSKFIGQTSGLRVQEFQNQLMAKNFKNRLTDEALAAAMRAEFPHAVAFTVAHVKGIRSQWNHGKRGNPVPEKALPEYDADRTPILRGKGGVEVAKKVKTVKAAK